MGLMNAMLTQTVASNMIHHRICLPHRSKPLYTICILRVRLLSHSRSHNDKNPEMLAHVKRGPLAPPTEEEQIQYLLMSKRRDEDRIQNSNYYAMEHVISYQRRIQATKKNFLQRGKRTPIGILRDWWERLLLKIVAPSPYFQKCLNRFPAHPHFELFAIAHQEQKHRCVRLYIVRV